MKYSYSIDITPSEVSELIEKIPSSFVRGVKCAAKKWPDLINTMKETIEEVVAIVDDSGSTQFAPSTTEDETEDEAEDLD